MSFFYFGLVLGVFFCYVFVFCVGLFAIYTFCSSGFMYFSPPIPSIGAVKDGMLADVSKHLEQSNPLTVMDLGCGWGTLLLPLAAKFPQHNFIGVEKAFLPYAVSKLRACKYNNLQIVRQDMFQTDIRQADVILLFLLSHVMKKMADKCAKELKKNTLIYANRFTMPNMTAIKKVSYGSDYASFYVYKVG